jgi:hypothetical protein
MDFNEVFEYDPEVPSGLRWKIDIWSGQDYRVLRVRKGQIAGSNKHKKGYWAVIYNKKSFRCSRIIWEMFYGKIPEGFSIDHMDRNKSNNSICNLRAVSNEINKRNSGKYSNNKSGKTGVRKITMSGVLYWCATWAEPSHKRRTAYFNTVKHGYEEAFIMACNKRDIELSKLKLIAGYSESHGE